MAVVVCCQLTCFVYIVNLLCDGLLYVDLLCVGLLCVDQLCASVLNVPVMK